MQKRIIIIESLILYAFRYNNSLEIFK